MGGLSILKILQDLAENCIGQKDLNALIEKCFKISKAYLCINQRKIQKLSSIHGLSPDDIAIDAIAQLFIKDEQGNYKFLKNSFLSWEPQIQNDEDALFFLNKIVSKRVSQHIISLLKEADPFFSKILDSLNYLMKKNGYQKTNYLGCIYIVKDEEDLLKNKPIDDITFNRIPANYFIGKNLFHQLFSYINKEGNFCLAIPLNLLVVKLKELNLSNLTVTNKENNFINLEVSEIVNNGFKKVLDKLELSYQQKGKLHDQEIANILKAFKDIANDLKDGGINRGLYDYLHTYMLNLSPDQYHLKYQNILDYLMKVMKSSIAQELKNI